MCRAVRCAFAGFAAPQQSVHPKPKLIKEGGCDGSVCTIEKSKIREREGEGSKSKESQSIPRERNHPIAHGYVYRPPTLEKGAIFGWFGGYRQIYGESNSDEIA